MYTLINVSFTHAQHAPSSPTLSLDRGLQCLSPMPIPTYPTSPDPSSLLYLCSLCHCSSSTVGIRSFTWLPHLHLPAPLLHVLILCPVPLWPLQSPIQSAIITPLPVLSPSDVVSSCTSVCSTIDLVSESSCSSSGMNHTLPVGHPSMPVRFTPAYTKRRLIFSPPFWTLDDDTLFNSDAMLPQCPFMP